MSPAAQTFSRIMWGALGGNEADVARVAFRGNGELPSAFPITDFAAASMACASLAIDALVAHAHPGAVRTVPSAGADVTVEIDRRLASFWFGTSLRPIGWHVPPLRDPLTGDYPTRDGWIRLHANAPHHRAAIQRVLGTLHDRNSAATAIATWEGIDLEQAIVAAGGCAAEMHDAKAWRMHSQGRAVATEPLVATHELTARALPSWPMPLGRPLTGIRVLDMTRVLAGPISTRFLAGLGATVLRIDAPDWDEPGAVPEVTLGKRCARLDLKTPSGHAAFTGLLAHADVFVHGLRPGALDALNLDEATRERLAPDLVDVSLDAYGWHGPWAARRGFDSLVQMSCGIAEAGMRWRTSSRPVPLPVQALDHATGYLMAAAVVRGLTRRLTHGVATRSRLSLARTAQLLLDGPTPWNSGPLANEAAEDVAAAVEQTSWGPACRVLTPWRIAGVDVRWDLPASALGSAPADWP